MCCAGAGSAVYFWGHLPNKGQNFIAGTLRRPSSCACAISLAVALSVPSHPDPSMLLVTLAHIALVSNPSLHGSHRRIAVGYFQRIDALLLLSGGKSSDAPIRRGLGKPMLIPTPETPPTPVERFRKDWAPPPYRIDEITLDINIRDGSTLVTSSLTVQPQEDAADQPLDLDGTSACVSNTAHLLKPPFHHV